MVRSFIFTVVNGHFLDDFNKRVKFEIRNYPKITWNMKYYLLTFSVSVQVLTKRTELMNYLSRHIADLKYISADLQDKLCTITIRTLRRDEGVVINLLALRGFKASFISATESV